MTTFRGKLEAAMRRNHSLLCVGLDIHPERLPCQDVAVFGRAVVEATADLVCAYKPNMAFYEALGMDGLRALERILLCIPSDVPVIGDGKRGDIGDTARAYAKAFFEVWGFDAMTVNPYLGHDAVQPFFEYAEKGVFVLCRTSNPGSGDFQSIVGSRDNDALPLYEVVAQKALEWNTRGNVGLVVGATYPEELGRVRAICPSLPILIPGVGVQGGDLAASVRQGRDNRGLGAIISASRQVLYASNGPDFAKAARQAALNLRDEMNWVRQEEGFVW